MLGVTGLAEARGLHHSGQRRSGGSAQRGLARSPRSVVLLLGLLACSTVELVAEGSEASAAFQSAGTPSGSGCLQTFQGGGKGLAPIYGRCGRCDKTQ